MAKETSKKNIYQKLLAVMEALPKIEKEGTNDFHHYKYYQELDLVNALKDLLVKEGVFITTSVPSQVHEGQLTLVGTVHKFVNVDEPEDFLEVQMVGQGSDSGDKGGYKAITGAMKYLLMKNFLIPSGDDPENDKGTKDYSKPNKKGPKLLKPVAKKQETVEDDEEDEEEEETTDEDESDTPTTKLSAKDLALIKPITSLLKNCVTEDEYQAAKKAALKVKGSLNPAQCAYVKQLMEEAKERIDE